jgi:hypothetical protein
VTFYGFGFEDDISADGSKRRVFGEAVAFSCGFSASLESPHLIVKTFVS